MDRSGSREILLSARGLHLRFAGSVALDGATLEVESGSVVGLIGPNGAGKTSLLNCISGFYRPDEGDVRLDEEVITGRRPASIARLGIARTFQHVELFKDATVIENVLLGRHMHMRSNLLQAGFYTRACRREERESRAYAEDVMELLDLGPFRDVPVGSMSWAQQKLVEVARALASGPRLLMLDEPSSGMSREEKEVVATLIMRLRRELGLTQVLIEHDVGFISDLSDKVVALDFGVVVAAGPPDQVLSHEGVIASYLGTPAVGTANGIPVDRASSAVDRRGGPQ